MTADPAGPRPRRHQRWPRRVYGVGAEPDPRFSFANERTFLAWVRTGLGFLAAGVAIAALADYNDRLTIEVRIAALILICCGLASTVGAVFRWSAGERAMRLKEPLPAPTLLPVITIGVVVVAVIAAIVVLLR